jgi:chemotaxis response regulator CheB
MPIRILVVDDHALLRKGIRLLTSAESDIQLVAEASNGREAVQEFRTHRPIWAGAAICGLAWHPRSIGSWFLR